MSRDEQVHRALASPVRARLLTVLRQSSRPVDVEQLATAVGLHPNTVRGHLSVLQEAGLVSRDTQRPDQPVRGPGRPRVVFEARAEPDEPVETDGYRFLAAVLAGSFAASVPDAAARAEEVGSAWGRHLVDAPAPGERLSDEEAIERVLELLERAGFAPDLSPGVPDAAAGVCGPSRLALRRCPFPDIARRHPEVVCAVHLGVMRGALAELGSTIETRPLVASFDGTPCTTELKLEA